jgi:thiamine-phosphate pyrophosphorylase
MSNPDMKGYYFITDTNLTKAGNIEDVKKALIAGVKFIQYRNKSGNTREIYNEAKIIKILCREYGAYLIINDRIDIALAVDADGVHIGQKDLPISVVRILLGVNKIIGVTVSTINEATDAEKNNADYLGVSPIFSTSTKKDAGIPIGIELLNQIDKNSSLPIVAIGGITLENTASVISNGADMICALSAVLQKDDIIEEINKFQRMFK